MPGVRLNAVKVQDRAGSATVSSLAESIRDTYLLEVYGLVIASAIIAYLLFLSRLPELGLVRKSGERSADEPVSSQTIDPIGPGPSEPSCEPALATGSEHQREPLNV